MYFQGFNTPLSDDRIHWTTKDPSQCRRKTPPPLPTITITQINRAAGPRQVVMGGLHLKRFFIGYCCIRNGFITGGAVRTTIDCLVWVVRAKWLKLLPANGCHITANKISQPRSKLDLEKSREVSLPFVSHCFVGKPCCWSWGSYADYAVWYNQWGLLDFEPG